MFINMHEANQIAHDRHQQLTQEAREARLIQTLWMERIGRAMNQVGQQLTAWGEGLQRSQNLGQPQVNLQ